jgi:hypothetical protein
MSWNRMDREGRRVFGSLLLLAFALGSFYWAVFVYAQDAPQGQAKQDNAKKKKGPGTPVVNARELPAEVTPGMMEVFRMSLGVECVYCHVSGDFQERGHNGDRQSDANPRKLIARDMIKMTKEINRGITGNGNYPDPSNVVTCWTCHRGNRHPLPSAPTASNAQAGAN